MGAAGGSFLTSAAPFIVFNHGRSRRFVPHLRSTLYCYSWPTSSHCGSVSDAWIATVCTKMEDALFKAEFPVGKAEVTVGELEVPVVEAEYAVGEAEYFYIGKE
jgi:hypothetical protein